MRALQEKEITDPTCLSDTKSETNFLQIELVIEKKGKYMMISLGLS